MKLVVASGNPGKLREIGAILAPLSIEVVAQSTLGIPEAEEPHATFLENALAKARHASRAAQLPALADDSGLCVDALDGAPGLFSADWAVGKDFGPAMARVWRELCRRGATEPEARGAHFVSALVVAWPDGHDELFEGRVHGTLV